MPSVTLPESAKLSQDKLVVGVIENIITVDQMFKLLPFDGIVGNALSYNRENALGGAGVVAVGGQITGDQNPMTGETAAAKAAATFTNITSGLTTILADAEVNGMIQATRSDQGNDQAAVQIASKAKHVGRIFKWMLINGTAGTTQFDGLINLCAVGQTITSATDGQALSLTTMDNLMDLVTAKDGVTDYYLMHARERRAYRVLLRASGGVTISELFELPSGEKVIAYSSVPILRNDNIPITQTQGNSSIASTVFAGCFDDGSQQQGLAGLTAQNAMGINVKDVGEKVDYDEHVWRVLWYSGLALYSEKALACAPGTIPV